MNRPAKTFTRTLALLCCVLALLTVPGVSRGVVLPTHDWRANDALHRTHLPHARAASSACEYAFAGENAQPQAQLCPGEVAPTSIASPRIARVGAGSHLGTPRDLLGSDGTVRWSAAYTAWGKIHEEYVADTQGPRGPPTEPIRSPFRLLGQYYDEETGLSATRFRMWEAETGRWLSPDPLGIVGGLNLLGFDGCPTRSADPLGLMSCKAKRAQEIVAQMQKERPELFQLGKCAEFSAELGKRLKAERIEGLTVTMTVERGPIMNTRTGENLTPVTAGGGTFHRWVDVDGVAFDNVTPRGASKDQFLGGLAVFPGANPRITAVPF